MPTIVPSTAPVPERAPLPFPQAIGPNGGSEPPGGGPGGPLRGPSRQDLPHVLPPLSFAPPPAAPRAEPAPAVALLPRLPKENPPGRRRSPSHAESDGSSNDTVVSKVSMVVLPPYEALQRPLPNAPAPVAVARPPKGDKGWLGRRLPAATATVDGERWGPWTEPLAQQARAAWQGGREVLRQVGPGGRTDRAAQDFLRHKRALEQLVQEGQFGAAGRGYRALGQASAQERARNLRLLFGNDGTTHDALLLALGKQDGTHLVRGLLHLLAQNVAAVRPNFALGSVYRVRLEAWLRVQGREVADLLRQKNDQMALRKLVRLEAAHQAARLAVTLAQAPLALPALSAYVFGTRTDTRGRLELCDMPGPATVLRWWLQRDPAMMIVYLQQAAGEVVSLLHAGERWQADALLRRVQQDCAGTPLPASVCARRLWLSVLACFGQCKIFAAPGPYGRPLCVAFAPHAGCTQDWLGYATAFGLHLSHISVHQHDFVGRATNLRIWLEPDAQRALAHGSPAHSDGLAALHLALYHASADTVGQHWPGGALGPDFFYQLGQALRGRHPLMPTQPFLAGPGRAVALLCALQRSGRVRPVSLRPLLGDVLGLGALDARLRGWLAS